MKLTHGVKRNQGNFVGYSTVIIINVLTSKIQLIWLESEFSISV